jgi:hypothetical protein
MPVATSWAILLCKFADDATEPKPRSFYERLFTTAGAGTMNMVRFFDENSHGSVTLVGSRVFGWYTLQQKRSDYLGSGPNWQGRQDLSNWAKQAAAAAKDDLSSFFGVVVVMNVLTDLFGGGGPQAVCDPGSMEPSVLAQEMGHGYGLAHSRVDGSEDDYRDPWDAMSTWNSCFMAPHPDYTRIGPGLNAANMRGRGWLDETRVWRGAVALLSTTFKTTIVLRPLHRKNDAGWLAAELPGGYLVEFRLKELWDAAIPRSAVLVHSFHSNHSYLHPSTAAKFDLGVGDKFETFAYFGASVRKLVLTVQQIDELSREATLEISQDIRLRSVPEMAASVMHSVQVDGGGWVLINGKLKRVPPRSPLLRILEQLMLFESEDLATMTSTPHDRVRREALDGVTREIELLRREVEVFHTPASLARED